MRTKWVGNTKVSYERSNRKSKKWMTRTPQGRIVHWGETVTSFIHHFILFKK